MDFKVRWLSNNRERDASSDARTEPFPHLQVSIEAAPNASRLLVGEIMPEQFEALALEMLKTDANAAIQAFSAATAIPDCESA
jgi:hypothetical protein